eukprot:gene17149-1819_t
MELATSAGRRPAPARSAAGGVRATAYRKGRGMEGTSHRSLVPRIE